MNVCVVLLNLNLILACMITTSSAFDPFGYGGHEMGLNAMMNPYSNQLSNKQQAQILKQIAKQQKYMLSSFGQQLMTQRFYLAELSRINMMDGWLLKMQAHRMNQEKLELEGRKEATTKEKMRVERMKQKTEKKKLIELAQKKSKANAADANYMHYSYDHTHHSDHDRSQFGGRRQRMATWM